MPPIDTTQISAHISDATSSELDQYVEARGLKKGYVIDQAIRHHLRALRELPPEVIIPPQIVVDRDTAIYLAERMNNPRPATPAMKALFSRKP